MDRIIHDLVQGSDAWHQFRLEHFGASEAAAMLGVSRKVKRNELLHAKKTGIAKEFSDWVQRKILDYGHEVEEQARPIVERMIGKDLYPATYSMGLLSASCDGISMDDSDALEHKQWNAEYGAMVAAGEVPEEHIPQCQQVLLVTGAERLLFVVSDGTEQNFASTWVYPDKAYQDRIVAGWHQFAKDLESFETSAPAPQIVAAPVETLPSVSVQVTGSLAVVDNLKTFGDALQTYVVKINRKPETDQDFADCESAIKTLTKAEEALDAAESSALAQVACIDQMRMLKATLKDLARSNRLMLEKLVKAEKENRRVSIVTAAQQKFRDFVSGLPHARLMPPVSADFGGAIKGLKTLASIQNAADTELARASIEATSTHNRIARNAAAIAVHPEHAGLFADRAALVLKDEDFVDLTISQRIADHQAKEAKRVEQIRAEEQAKAEKAAADKLAKEQREATARAEQQARDEALKAQSAAPATQEAAPVIAQPAPNTSVQAPNIAQAAANTAPSATMSLGQINACLAPISLTKDGLAVLGIYPVGKERAAILFSSADMPNICAALVRHINAISLKKAA